MEASDDDQIDHRETIAALQYLDTRTGGANTVLNSDVVDSLTGMEKALDVLDVLPGGDEEETLKLASRARSILGGVVRL